MPSTVDELLQVRVCLRTAPRLPPPPLSPCGLWFVVVGRCCRYRHLLYYYYFYLIYVFLSACTRSFLDSQTACFVDEKSQQAVPAGKERPGEDATLQKRREAGKETRTTTNQAPRPRNSDRLVIFASIRALFSDAHAIHA